MASRDIEAQIRQRVDAFLKEIGDLVRQSAVQAVQDALGVGSSSSMRRGPAPAAAAPATARRKGKRTGKKRGRRSGGGGGGASPDAIVNFLRQNPNARMEQVSAALGADSAAIRPTMQGLIDSGVVRKAGERRGTTYNLA